jgi:hypothetical protein
MTDMTNHQQDEIDEAEVAREFDEWRIEAARIRVEACRQFGLAPADFDLILIGEV